MKLTRRLFLTGAGALPAWSALAAPGIQKIRDKRTGREIWQITAGQFYSHCCYFEAQPFTADDRYLVYCSLESGSWQLYRADLRTQEHRQLTHCADLSNLSYSIHPDGTSVFYQDGTNLAKTDVVSGKSSVIVDMARAIGRKGSVHAGRTFSLDGMYATVGWSSDDGQGIALLNLKAARVEKSAPIVGGTGGHMLICPADPFLVTYSATPDHQNDMSLPMEQRPRTLIVDLRTGKSRPYLIMPYGFRATHEYWGPGGARLFFHKKKVPGWVPASIGSMKRDGTGIETHFTSDYMLGHSMVSSDGRYIVSDVQKPNDNPLILVDIEKRTHEVLCWPDSSVSGGHPKQAHVHPSFSRSGKFVAYTSDRSGTPQVYVVPL